MGEQTLTLRKAWSVYDRWLADPRVEFYPEPRGIDEGFRQTTGPFAARSASKWIGNCWLLASTKGLGATFVTATRHCMRVPGSKVIALSEGTLQEPRYEPTKG